MSADSGHPRHEDEHAQPGGRPSRVEIYVTTDTSAAPHKTGEDKLYVMRDAANPGVGELYFTQSEWEAFVAGVKDGEFDLDSSGSLPDLD
jgi:hypothetical protein